MAQTLFASVEEVFVSFTSDEKTYGVFRDGRWYAAVTGGSDDAVAVMNKCIDDYPNSEWTCEEIARY